MDGLIIVVEVALFTVIVCSVELDGDHSCCPFTTPGKVARNSYVPACGGAKVPLKSPFVPVIIRESRIIIQSREPNSRYCMTTVLPDGTLGLLELTTATRPVTVSDCRTVGEDEIVFKVVIVSIGGRLIILTASKGMVCPKPLKLPSGSTKLPKIVRKFDEIGIGVDM